MLKKISIRSKKKSKNGLDAFKNSEADFSSLNRQPTRRKSSVTSTETTDLRLTQRNYDTKRLENQRKIKNEKKQNKAEDSKELKHPSKDVSRDVPRNLIENNHLEQNNYGGNQRSLSSNDAFNPSTDRMDTRRHNSADFFQQKPPNNRHPPQQNFPNLNNANFNNPPDILKEPVSSNSRTQNVMKPQQSDDEKPNPDMQNLVIDVPKEKVSKLKKRSSKFAREKEFEKSHELLEEALTIQEKYSFPPLEIAHTLHQIGRIFNNLQRYKQSLDALHASLNLRKKFNAERLQIASTIHTIGVVWGLFGDRELAVKNLTTAASMQEEVLGKPDETTMKKLEEFTNE